MDGAFSQYRTSAGNKNSMLNNEQNLAYETACIYENIMRKDFVRVENYYG